MKAMSCYLCKSRKISLLHPRCRDAVNVQVLRCDHCGLVFLDNIEKVTEEFYENSGMYEFAPIDRAKLIAEEREDTDRRVAFLRPIVKGKRVLDFGCGTGAVAAELKDKCLEISVVELNLAQRAAIEADCGIKAARDIAELKGAFDLITMFHVLEHLPDPIKVLKDLRGRLAPGGKLIVEVPHAGDALLETYKSAAFRDFTFWSLHLYLFTESTLSKVFELAGFEATKVEFVQRYNLANHLHWLAVGKPGGHKAWKELSSTELDSAYAQKLADLKLTDTLIATSSA